jgi:bile acid:Na+ symporter, BASS family
VIVPVVTVILVQAFDFPHAAELAVIALAISPLPPLLPRNLIAAGRGAPYPAALMAAVALLSIVIVPLLAALIGHYLGPSFALPPLRIAGMIAATVLLPLAAGMVVRALRPAFADRIELPASLVGTAVLRLATLAPPTRPGQSDGAPSQPLPDEGTAAGQATVNGEQAARANRDGTMGAVLAHLVGW